MHTSISSAALLITLTGMGLVMWSEMPEWQRRHLTTVLRMRARSAAGPAPTPGAPCARA